VLVPRTSDRIRKAWIWTFVLAYGGFVGLARIVIGAHYASDVLFSTAITWFVFWFFSRKGLSQRALSEDAQASTQT